MCDKKDELFSLEDVANMDFGPSIADILLDEENDENIVLFDENDQPCEFEQIAVVPMNGKIYAILKPVDCMEEVGEDEALVFCLEECDGDYELVIETDNEIGEAVFASYYSMFEDED